MSPGRHDCARLVLGGRGGRGTVSDRETLEYRDGRLGDVSTLEGLPTAAR